MSRTMTPQDCHVIMNEIVKQATGQNTLGVVNTSNFVSAGETALASGVENVYNAISILVGRTLVATRPYNARLNLINRMDTGSFTNRLRKLSFYSQGSVASGWYNTDLYTNLKNGYTNGRNITDSTENSTKSMWEQSQKPVLEMNYCGSSTWQDSLTVYEDQLKIAFRSEDEFARFWSGIMTEKANDIESQKEAFNRMCLLNMIGAIYDDSANRKYGVVNLTSEFNKKFGTSYTSEELRSTQLTKFLEFFVAEFKKYSDYMTERTVLFHNPVAKTIEDEEYVILRHTPKDRQRAILYQPLFTDATAQVLPEIFNDRYLNVGNYEGVNYWQNVNNRAAVNITPAIPDYTTGTQTAGANVSLDYVVGMLYDEDAMMIDYQLERATSTPLEARKGYRNLWWTFAKNPINDLSENAILFTMEDTTSESKTRTSKYAR